MKSKAGLFRILLLAALAQPLVAVAHPFHWANESLGFVGGLIHPLTGPDHVLMMLALGLWLTQADKRWVYFMPVLFVVFMLAGCALSLSSIEIAHAENLQYLFVLLLGLIWVSRRDVAFSIGTLIVAGVAVFHGYAHAYDIWLDADAIGYTMGFAFTTLLLIMGGVVSKLLINRCVIRFAPKLPGEG